MYIKSFKYHNHALEWQLELLELNRRVTLLVGASGVGKTRILQALLDLKRLAKGASLDGVEWEVEFVTAPDLNYRWKGAFENQGTLPDFFFDSLERKEGKDHERLKIIYEELYCNDQHIFVRNHEDILFNDVKTVRLTQHQSVIHLLKKEEILSTVYSNLLKINFSETVAAETSLFQSLDLTIAEEYTSLEQIRESQLDTELKLYLAYLNAKPTFDRIRERFVEMFPSVEDLTSVEQISVGVLGPDWTTLPPLSTPFPSHVKYVPLIQIKEKGVKHWIHKGQISSGMYRSLMHLCDLHLSANGSVFLIDEFENSLGVNCIGEVTNDLTIYQRDIQFILTSHHPYIINNIHYDNWKVITRKGGIVKTRNATEFNLGKSKHQAFTQLINLDEYVEGVEE